MIKYFCDKCGKELEHNEFASDLYKVTVYPQDIRKWTDDAETGTYILCHECIEKFIKWLCNQEH